MSEPKRGEHDEFCLMTKPRCKCNTCRQDTSVCCFDKFNLKNCPVLNCKNYLADEPTKKGAADV